MLKTGLWIFLGLFLLFVARVVIAVLANRNRTTPMPKDDPWLHQAVSHAQESFDEMRSLVGQGLNVAVKFPLRNGAGEIEHVWGGVRSVHEDALELQVLTPLLVGPTPEGLLSVQRQELEDWQCFLPSGGIRGGFSTQAQLAVCRREGLRIPPALLNQDPHFLDRIEFSSLQATT